MTKIQEEALCAAFSKLLDDLQHTVPVGGKLLPISDLSSRAGISTKTYAKIKEASILNSPSI